MPLTNITSGAVAEPFTLEEAKAHLIVEHEKDDALITAQMIAARTAAETFIGQPIVAQGWRYTLDCFPDIICLPRVPVTAVTQFDYIDTNGATQTLAPAAYVLRAEKAHANIVRAYGTQWPSTRPGWDTVTIEFATGYGAAGPPADIIHAIKLILGELYFHREDSVQGTIIAKVPISSKELLKHHQVLAL